MPKKKIKRNITGLRNQPRPAPVNKPEASEAENRVGNGNDDAPHSNVQAGRKETCVDDDDSVPHSPVDSSKVISSAVDNKEEISSDNKLDFVDQQEISEVQRCVNTRKNRNSNTRILSAKQNRDHPRDEDLDWVPKARRSQVRTERPKEYMKGPDVGSKSRRTKRRYKDLLRGQTTLDSLGFNVPKKVTADITGESDRLSFESEEPDTVLGKRKAPSADAGRNDEALFTDDEEQEDELDKCFAPEC